MKVAFVVLTVLGSALAASINIGTPDIPLFRDKTIKPLLPPPRNNSGLGIVNGQEVTPHSIPYQVYFIGKNTQYEWSCGGSLITTKFVLTAAHCIDGATAIEITLGAHNLLEPNPGQITIAAKSWKIHESYNPNTIDNDVGVVELQTAAQLNNIIQLVDLPSAADVSKTFVGETSRVSGWGLTSGHGFVSRILLATQNPIIRNDLCNLYYGVVRNEEICMSGASGRAACQGDSGGPLVIGNVQVGVVSYGSNGCLNGYPSVFARVTSFLSWIKANTDL